MKSKRIEQLINILKNTNSDISSLSLSRMIGTSEKTIRNYIKEINEQTDYRVESSKNGYHLVKIADNMPTLFNNIIFRENYVLSKLLSDTVGVSIFDLAEELCISESTIINNVIPKIKELTSQFNLTIQSQNYQYSLKGKESQKRKLIGYLVTHNNYGYFTSTEILEKIFPSIDIKKNLEKLYDICQQTNLFLNDYSMNNFLIHLIIIWIRVQSNNTISFIDNFQCIDNIVSYSNHKKEILSLANNIKKLFEEDYQFTLPLDEYHQIIFLITLSTDHNFENLKNIIEPTFMKDVLEIAKHLSLRFNIPEFDYDFLIQFSLHMYNAYHRAKINMSYPNPIAQQIKSDYALVYDIAIFFAHSFSIKYRIKLNEDEIAFIAFHIGAYLENNKNILNSTSCIIISENYHDFSKHLVNQIKDTFKSELIILDVISLDNYIKLHPSCDLLITTIQIQSNHQHKILINPILTKQNIRNIWDEIEIIENEKSLKKAKIFLNQFLNKKLYVRNINLNSPEEYINYMGNICYENDYITPEFTHDVLLRESMSSTAFTDCIAIPHTISQYAKQSFIFIIHNDRPINWEKQNIHFILMIGIAENDMKYFKDVFNLLIELFSSMHNTLRIMNTNSFEEFKQTILSI